jgi:pilus assembly protein CpaE
MMDALKGEAGLGLPIVLIGTDGAFLDKIAEAFSPKKGMMVATMLESIETAAKNPDLDMALVVVVDLDTKRRESLNALQGLMARLNGQVPVVVITDAFDDTLARWFLQIKVADFLRKPVEGKEVLRACIRTLRATMATDLPDVQSQILSFVPAAGGVGATTIAIESAMLLLRQGGGEGDSVCLIDLDFQNGACADYLDLDPRLDLSEVARQPERLDLQLMEVMLARHASGLPVLSARGRPAEMTGLNLEVVVRLLDLASTRFDHVVIDLPRAWEPWTDHVLNGSNRVYIITDTTVPGLRLARQYVGAMGKRLTDVKPKIIVNRFDKTLFGNGLRKSDIERALDGALAGTIANNYKLVRDAIDRGVPLETIKAHSNVSTDLKKIILAQAGE